MKEKREEKKCTMRFSIIKNKTFQKNYMKMGTEEVATSGYGASKDEVSSCGRVGACRKIKIEEVDGGSSRQKEYDFVFFFLFMEAFGLEIEEELSLLATQYWAEAVWMVKWCLELKEAWMN